MTRYELRRATETYGSYREQWFDILITFVLDHSRAMESYGELRRAMGKKVHIKLKHDHTRAIDSYVELRRAMESYGEPWVKQLNITT